MLVYLDQQSVKRFTHSLKPSSINRLYCLFGDELTRLKGNIIHSLENNEEEQLHAYAHALKGCASNYGATTLSRFANSLENAKIDKIYTNELLELLNEYCDGTQKEALELAAQYKH